MMISRISGHRLKRLFRFLFGLLLCFYSTILFKQHRASAIYANEHAKSLIYPQDINEVSSPRRRLLDDLLSKYNIASSDERNSKLKVPDADRSIAFLHIGKTGGSTISMHLRNGCHESYMTPCVHRKDGWLLNETVASRRIEAYYHIGGIPPERLDRVTTIVTAVRNPVSRFLSAFAYGHPTNGVATEVKLDARKLQQYSCFPSISYMIKAAMGRAEIPWNKAHLMALRQQTLNRRTHSQKSASQQIPPINCTELARIAFGLNKSWEVVDSSHPWPSHMTYDYRQYYSSMPLDKEIIAMRHGHLWDDWVKVNQLLGAENDSYRNWPSVPPFDEIHRNVSGQYRMKTRWKVQTGQEQEWLCRLLKEEIRTYLVILTRAINLDDNDLWDAATDVDGMCNDQNHKFGGDAKSSPMNTNHTR